MSGALRMLCLLAMAVSLPWSSNAWAADKTKAAKAASQAADVAEDEVVDEPVLLIPKTTAGGRAKSASDARTPANVATKPSREQETGRAKASDAASSAPASAMGRKADGKVQRASNLDEPSARSAGRSSSSKSRTTPSSQVFDDSYGESRGPLAGRAMTLAVNPSPITKNVPEMNRFRIPHLRCLFVKRMFSIRAVQQFFDKLHALEVQ